MKTFIFTVSEKNARYGVNYNMKVYRIKNNKPVFIGETSYNSGSYRGHEDEALNVIIKAKELPKKCQTRSGYVNFDELNKSFTLNQLG
jgi:hypothetical protein